MSRQHLLRVLTAHRFTLASIVAVCAVMLGSLTSLAGAGSVTYSDVVTGISFVAPAGLDIAPARAGVSGRTTQAIFTTYRQGFDPKVTRVDLTRELSISAYIADRPAGQDLRTFLATNAQGARYVVADLPRLGGIVATGLFQSGPRKYALIPRDAEHVLIVDAYPTFSSRIGLFDAVLATLVVN